MASFDIRAPASGNPHQTFRLEAASWIDALKDAMARLGRSLGMGGIHAEMRGDGSMLVKVRMDGFEVLITEVKSRKSAPSAPVDHVQMVSPLVSRPRVKGVVRGQIGPGISAERTKPPDPTVAPTHRRKAVSSADLATLPERPAHQSNTAPAPPHQPLAARSPEKPALAPPKLRLDPKLRSQLERAFWTGWNERACERLLELVLEHIPAESGTVYQLNRARKTLSFAAVWGPRARRLKDVAEEIPAESGVAGFCTLHRVPLALKEAGSDARFNAELARKLEYAVHSMLTCPIASRSSSLGCIQLINRKGGGAFSEGELSLLFTIADAAAELALNVPTLR